MENTQVGCKKTGFKGVIASVIDQAISLAIAGVLELVFDFVIKFIGYQISDKLGILLVMYVIVCCLYTPIFENSGNCKTIGKKLLKL